MFSHGPFSSKFLTFTDEHRAAPIQDTAQQRHRRRRAAGTRSKDSFQIKTLRKPFLLSLVDIHPLVFSGITKEEAGVLACGHVRIFARTWTLGAFLTKSVVSPALIKNEHLRECSASQVLALYASAPNHVFGQMLGCPAPEFGYLTFRSIGVTPSMRLYLPRVEARLRGITALKAMSQVR